MYIYIYQFGKEPVRFDSQFGPAFFGRAVGSVRFGSAFDNNNNDNDNRSNGYTSCLHCGKG